MFQRQPNMRALFWRDADGAIRGEMLARVFEAILDFIGECKYAHHLIQCEVVTHEGYDVPRDVFATFFDVVAEVVRDACGPEWAVGMEVSWRQLLEDLDFFVSHPGKVPG